MSRNRLTRPKLLDLFCCAGGAGMGYHRAGFDVTGVDINPQPRYPFEFIQGDALEYLAEHGHEYDAIHASPPCQDHSTLNALHDDHGTGWMLTATIDALEAQSRPWVVENVQGAAESMPGAVLLCGSMFGLSGKGRDHTRRQLRRHRLFLSSEFIMTPPCMHWGEPVGVYGTGGGGKMTRGYKAHREDAAEALGIDWMTMGEMSQAIPPAYTYFIGDQLRLQAVSA